LAVGNELIYDTTVMNTPLGQISLLTTTDCVKDRLASYFYWNDRQALDQALLMAQTQKINMKNIKEWAKHENADEKFQHFVSHLNKSSK